MNSETKTEDTISPRALQVDSHTGKKPKIVAQMADWQYLERSLHRMMAGWGRHFSEWTDKVAVSRHVWEQSECVRRLRERLEEFPGTTSNLETPVSATLETLVNTVLLAPAHEDAVDGIYQILTGALVQAYLAYAQAAHPVHDAPTVAMLSDIVRIKEQQRLWLRDYRRRHPHVTDSAYKACITQMLDACGGLSQALPVEGKPALPVGVRTPFRPPARAAVPVGTETQHEIMPLLEADFTRSLEARRLFWCYGYMLEMHLAEDQLLWLYDGWAMPWEFLQDVSRHLWDESRHGDSGYSRLLDFGISLEEIGYASSTSDADLSGEAAVISPKQLYDMVFFIGLVAETGHFSVKHEAYADLKEGGDLESAEMMLFDIIDETSHVQYAHKWLPMLAERAGLAGENFKQRGSQVREQCAADAKERALSAPSHSENDAAYHFYQEMLARMRTRQPLTNAAICPPRSFKPM